MELADCGAACLSMVLAYHGHSALLGEVREATGTGRGGVDALRLVEASAHYGLIARGVRADVDQLHLLPAGSVLHWGFDHFVVFERSRRGSVDLVDPAVGRRRVPLAEFGKRYTGIAITFEPGQGFRRKKASARGTWRYLRPVLGQVRLVRRTLVTSLSMRVFALALPLLMSVLVDQVLRTGDSQLLVTVSLAGLVMVAYFAFASWLRSHFLLELRTRLDAQLAVGFVGHLVSLPYAFFLERSTGDLITRLRSNTVARELLTTGALSALLDGVMVCLYLVLLLMLNWPLGLAVLGLGCLQVLVLTLSGSRSRKLARESLEVEARSAGYVYQLLSGIETLKAAGVEHRGVEHWTNLFAAEINASLARGRLSAAVDALMSGLRLASPLLILSLGGAQVLAGHLTLGSMLALSALAAGFLEPLAALVATGLQIQVLGSHMGRINDVLDTPAEQHGVPVQSAGALRGEIEADAISFRYSPLAPPVVRDVSLRIQPGQKVAIVGRSGSGKTTLAHLLLGLYMPEAGRILYDGTDLAHLEVHSVRRQIGIVTQDTQLFGTSIRDNIALADPSLSLQLVERAAHLACIHDDIASMPLGYATPLGDGGATLSGGQRQRVALARALAQQPSILLLDEATSALDALTERQVFQNLADLGRTTIVIAHRLSTIRDADLILVMAGGRLVEHGRHDELMAVGGEYRQLVLTQAAPVLV
jgi:ABC-type bacteriocin/lantibiotic exporter with double-glycine peptidase domain